MTGIDPRKPYIEPKKRGVKEGTERGHYKIKKKNRRLYTKICLGCGQEFTTYNKAKIYHNRACKQCTYRKRRIILGIEIKKAEMTRI